MPEHFVQAISGLSREDLELLDPRGHRWLHALISVAVAAAAGMATCGVLVPRSGYASVTLLGLLLCCAIAAAGEVVALLVLCGLAALVALAVLLFIMATAKGGGLSLSAAASLLVGAASYAIARAVRARRRRKHGLDLLARLHANAARFNKVLSSLDVKDRLAAAQGARVDTVARASLNASLTLARESLVRTLKVERILRENRALLEDVGGAVVELVPIESLRVHGEADDHARALQQAADRAVDVQAAFDELQRHEGVEPTH